MNILKFDGKFTNLKEHGFEFNKLYTSNYKCYIKKFPRFTPMLMVWVAQRSIEISGFGDKSKGLIEFLQSIDWSTIPQTPRLISKNVRVYINNHGEISTNKFSDDDDDDILTLFITENVAIFFLKEIEMLTNGFYN